MKRSNHKINQFLFTLHYKTLKKLPFLQVDDIITFGMEESSEGLKLVEISKGVLEDGNWKVISQSREVDHYEVEFQGKHIEVIAEMHGTKEAKEALSKVLEKIKVKPKSWYFLIEGLGEKRPTHSFIHKHGIKAQSLPGRYIGLDELVKNKTVTVNEAALSIAIEQLEALGRLLEHNLYVEKIRERGPVKVATRVAKAILSGIEMPVDWEKVESALRKTLAKPDSIKESIKKANHLLYEKANDTADHLQSQTISEALSFNFPNYLILIGKDHLGSLIRSGKLSRYTKDAISNEKIQYSTLQLALSEQ